MFTWREYAGRVQEIAAGLAALDVGHGDTVALMMTNRPEFHLVDTAALHLGAAPFSIYTTFDPGRSGMYCPMPAARWWFARNSSLSGYWLPVTARR